MCVLVYDFRKVNETNSNGKDNSTEHWDFKHPAFTKANINKLHNIRRKPPKKRTASQTSQSSSWDVSPSISPDCEGESSTYCPNNTSDNYVPQIHYEYIQNSQTIPESSKQYRAEDARPLPINETIAQLKSKADILESKIDETNYEVYYLKNIINSQRIVSRN